MYESLDPLIYLEPVFNKLNNRLSTTFPLCVVAPQSKPSAFSIVAPSLEKKPFDNRSSFLLNTGSYKPKLLFNPLETSIEFHISSFLTTVAAARH